MTYKEAIEILKPLTECSVNKDGIGTFPMVSTPLQVEALELAIKILEEAERPQGDLISRKQVLDELMAHQYSRDFCIEHHIEQSIHSSMVRVIVDRTPTVYAPTDADIIEANKEGFNTARRLYERQGKWIRHRNDYGHNIADCSLCGKVMQWHDEDEDGIPRYCWYCGAKMEGV